MKLDIQVEKGIENGSWCDDDVNGGDGGVTEHWGMRLLHKDGECRWQAHEDDKEGSWLGGQTDKEDVCGAWKHKEGG